MNYAQIVTNIVLAVAAILIYRVMIRSHKDHQSKINLEDLLLGEDGKISKAACLAYGAFALSTWMMVALTTQGKMAEGYFLAYIGVWATPSVAKIIWNKPPESKA